ncbi:DUF1330 domain-containing protein [Altererythrobacter arenosus]|uniref:DUF1330 domain-containing protein n=1 Tax=Altererythrobacter arenosus TaxID=3032592 RepID=A0ABY8FYN2_9SPHN|nr:DUF1330 domain-containing protein [Altererythrobacter sp. CAU 1644]WFL78396.1 DUF1330 domain-containing protein [Altererythrobacter sp. CAU 1644]
MENAKQPTPEQFASFFGEEESGAFTMINLLKFREKAQYDDGSDAELSGREAYLRYGMAVQACLAAVGARSIYSGAVTGLMIGEVDELWDMVALAEYPSLAAFQQMIALPEYQAAHRHREAGLAGQLNIKTRSLAG